MSAPSPEPTATITRSRDARRNAELRALLLSLLPAVPQPTPQTR